MKTLIGTQTANTLNSVSEGTSQAGVGIIIALAAMIGIWGASCLVCGLIQNGIFTISRGFISAVTGL